MFSLNINLLWTILNLLILFLLVKRFLFKPVHKILDARAAEIAKGYADVESAKNAANSLKQEYETSMAAIADKRLQILAETGQKADEEYKRIIEDAKAEARKTLNQAEIAAQKEHDKKLREARDQITDLVVAATAKIVGAGMNVNSDMALYDQFINKKLQTPVSDKAES
jgi:F-type H+-transporting ATPase subunit b